MLSRSNGLQRHRGFTRGACLVIGALLLVMVLTTRASAGTPATAWQITTLTSPTVLPPAPGKHGKYDVVLENIGGAASEGPIAFKDVVSPGLTITRVRIEPELSPEGEIVECNQAATEVECPVLGVVVPSGFVVMQVEFVTSGATGIVENVATVSGGHAPEVTHRTSVRVGAENESGPAGVAQFEFTPTDVAGQPVTQAGGHPHFLTTTLIFNNLYEERLGQPTQPVEAVRDLAFYLPLGMLGNTTVADPCPASLVETQPEKTGCPPSSRVGTILPMILSNVFANTTDPTRVHGIYSVAPERGYPAEFAFASNGLTFFVYATVVRRHGQYVLRVASPGVPVISRLVGLIATFNGDIQEHYFQGEEEVLLDRGAFLTNPMNCANESDSLQATVAANTWQHPERELQLSATTSAFASITGCDQLTFTPGMRVTPSTKQADAPAGYTVGLEVPQAPNVASGLGTPPVRDVSVTLPEGTSVAPGGANGLRGCDEEGPNGINIEGPESEEIGQDGLERVAPGHCPAASQIGTVTAETPLLREQLPGHLFVATPQCGGPGQSPCQPDDAENGRLFRLYLELEAPKSGVIVKLQGHASVNRQTGRITTIFDDNPQFPLSNLSVSTNKGPRATLANALQCGTATSLAAITPWSSSTPATPSDSFDVDWNGAGEGCPASAPFGPTFAAGTTSPVAATTSPFTLTVKREDREQNISQITTTLPEGLLANISKVSRCAEPAASQASLTACPAASQIGSATVAVGSGSEPYFETGKVFFTGPYKGAPFGLSIVVPAVAGPFNLGDVLVRAALFVDPHTAQATAVSDPPPQILDGVPLRLRTIAISLDNSEFVLNPTSCLPSSITGTISSTTGGIANVASPFAVKGCRNLAFKPLLSGSTEKKATKANGTGVRIKIAYPSGPAEANIAKVVLAFPKQLPVRLETLQQACRAATFEANPAACPAGSNIGTATVHTPILAQPLSGPAYLVSYGSAKFPDVVFVLQGEGITLDVDGQSFVSHTGELRVTFASVPDAPFSTFETVLPAGRYSQFTSSRTTGKAQASQCGENLIAPVTMTAYNGAQLTQKAKLKVAGCGPTVSIGKVHATAHSLTATVTTSVNGRLRISGAGLKTLTRRNLRAGTHKLTVPLTGRGRAAARVHTKIQLTVGLAVGKQRASAHKRVRL